MVRGYHVYGEIWDASIDVELLCAREHEVSKFSLKYKDPRNIRSDPRRSNDTCALAVGVAIPDIIISTSRY